MVAELGVGGWQFSHLQTVIAIFMPHLELFCCCAPFLRQLPFYLPSKCLEHLGTPGIMGEMVPLRMKQANSENTRQERFHKYLTSTYVQRIDWFSRSTKRKND